MLNTRELHGLINRYLVIVQRYTVISYNNKCWVISVNVQTSDFSAINHPSAQTLKLLKGSCLLVGTSPRVTGFGAMYCNVPIQGHFLHSSFCFIFALVFFSCLLLLHLSVCFSVWGNVIVDHRACCSVLVLKYFRGHFLFLISTFLFNLYFPVWLPFCLYPSICLSICSPLLFCPNMCQSFPKLNSMYFLLHLHVPKHLFRFTSPWCTSCPST